MQRDGFETRINWDYELDEFEKNLAEEPWLLGQYDWDDHELFS